METYPVSYTMVGEDGMRLTRHDLITAPNKREARKALKASNEQLENILGVAIINIRWS